MVGGFVSHINLENGNMRPRKATVQYRHCWHQALQIYVSGDGRGLRTIMSVLVLNLLARTIRPQVALCPDFKNLNREETI